MLRLDHERAGSWKHVYPRFTVKYLYGMLGIVVSCAKRDLEFYMTCNLFIWMCMVYKALVDTLRMDFARAFLELWFRIISLELWLGMKGKHVAFLEW